MEKISKIHHFNDINIINCCFDGGFYVPIEGMPTFN